MNPGEFGTVRTINAKVIAISFFMARHQTSPPRTGQVVWSLRNSLITFDHKLV